MYVVLIHIRRHWWLNYRLQRVGVRLKKRRVDSLEEV